MLAVLGEDLAKNVDDVASLGHRQFDIDIFQAYVRIETADLLQGFPPEHQGGRHRARLAVQEQVIEVEMAERQVAFALLLSRHDPAIGVDDLDIARADTYLGLVPHVCHLFLQALRQHDVVRTERHDEISPGPGDRLVERSRQSLVLLDPEVEAVLRLEPAQKLDAAIAGTIVHHQQFHVAVCLRSHAGNARFYVLFVVIGSDDHGNQWLRTIIDERHNYNLTCPSRPHSKRQTCMSDPAIFIGPTPPPSPEKQAEQ